MNSLIFKKSYKIVSKRDHKLLASPKKSQLEIKIMAAGICGTDLSILKGDFYAKPGIILGHEASGIVTRVSLKTSPFKIGDRVVINPTAFCKKCGPCLAQKPQFCHKKKRLEKGVSCDGLFTGKILIDQSFVHKIPKNLDYYTATLTEPMACVLEGLSNLELSTHKNALVIGGGPIGALISLRLKQLGHNVCILESSKYRLQWAKQNLGNSNGFKTWPNLKKPFDLIIDTTGFTENKLVQLCLKKIQTQGQILLMGIKRTQRSQFFSHLLVEKNIKLVGSVDSAFKMEQAIKILSQNKEYQSLITHALEFEQFQLAFMLLGIDLNKRCSLPIAALKVCFKGKSNDAT